MWTSFVSSETSQLPILQRKVALEAGDMILSLLCLFLRVLNFNKSTDNWGRRRECYGMKEPIYSGDKGQFGQT